MKNKHKKAIYAFSGDPITCGHIDIIKRAANVFDEVLVGIGINPDKSYLFTLDERKKMAYKSLKNIKNVKVSAFEGLLVDFAYENNIQIIIKGVRNSADFDYENNLHQIGESQKLGIDTYILFAKPELAHVSSSSVKSIQSEHGFIHEYVPLFVKQSIEAKISGQYIIGITGEIGSGKSYIGKKFEELAKKKKIQLHNIELDNIGHEIYESLDEPVYTQIREKLAEMFGSSIKNEDGTINRKKLGDIVFNDESSLKKLNEIMYTPLLVRTRRVFYKKKGLIVFNAALIAESNMGYLCNNNIVLVNVDKETQKVRLQKRNLTGEQIERRLASQYSYNQKRNIIEERIKLDNNGKIWEINNSTIDNEKEIEKVFDDIVKYLKVK